MSTFGPPKTVSHVLTPGDRSVTIYWVPIVRRFRSALASNSNAGRSTAPKLFQRSRRCPARVGVVVARSAPL